MKLSLKYIDLAYCTVCSTYTETLTTNEVYSFNIALYLTLYETQTVLFEENFTIGQQSLRRLLKTGLVAMLAAPTKKPRNVLLYQMTMIITKTHVSNV